MRNLAVFKETFLGLIVSHTVIAYNCDHCLFFSVVPFVESGLYICGKQDFGTKN